MLIAKGIPAALAKTSAKARTTRAALILDSMKSNLRDCENVRVVREAPLNHTPDWTIPIVSKALRLALAKTGATDRHNLSVIGMERF